MIHRFLAVIGSAAALAACSSDVSGLKSGAFLDTVSLESEPPGAEAKASNGQTCRTPCALALPADASSSGTFTLTGDTRKEVDETRKETSSATEGCSGSTPRTNDGRTGSGAIITLAHKSTS